MTAERHSTRHLILQYNLATHCMYVSHAMECNYSCGNFRYIIDTTSATATCTCLISSHVRYCHGTSHQALKTKAERKMAEKHTVSRPGCISKHKELVRQVSEG